MTNKLKAEVIGKRGAPSPDSPLSTIDSAGKTQRDSQQNIFECSPFYRPSIGPKPNRAQKVQPLLSQSTHRTTRLIPSHVKQKSSCTLHENEINLEHVEVFLYPSHTSDRIIPPISPRATMPIPSNRFDYKSTAIPAMHVNHNTNIKQQLIFESE